jgi:hypothetical protein
MFVVASAQGATSRTRPVARTIVIGESDLDHWVARARPNELLGHVERRQVASALTRELHDHPAGMTTSPGSALLRVTAPGASADNTV